MKSVNFKKRKLALVDDESALLELYKEILGHTYEILTFENPQKFLSVLVHGEPFPFDILMTDLNMPGMNGIEMIKSAQKNGFYFPSILLSGYLDKNSVFAAVDLGVYRLIEKPTSPDIVISSIEELLIEYEIRDTRNEIRQITNKMREYYSFVRLFITNNIPAAEAQNFSLQVDQNGQVINQENFDKLLDQLDERLEKLLKSENILEEVRAKRYKNIA